MLTPSMLFNLSNFDYAEIFDNCTYPWNALAKIKEFAEKYFTVNQLSKFSSSRLDITILGDVHVGEGTKIESGVYIQGPAIIGKNCEIRQGAYIRGNIITGNNCVIGHTTEVKNGIFLNGAKAGHFAYIGDSILGNNVDLGAGVKLSNVKLLSIKDAITNKRPNILLTIEGSDIDTGLNKLGAIIGDGVQIGCNVVTNPGCVIGPSTIIYPLVSLKRGYYPGSVIIKDSQNLCMVPRK